MSGAEYTNKYRHTQKKHYFLVRLLNNVVNSFQSAVETTSKIKENEDERTKNKENKKKLTEKLLEGFCGVLFCCCCCCCCVLPVTQLPLHSIHSVSNSRNRNKARTKHIHKTHTHHTHPYTSYGRNRNIINGRAIVWTNRERVPECTLANGFSCIRLITMISMAQKKEKRCMYTLKHV